MPTRRLTLALLVLLLLMPVALSDAAAGKGGNKPKPPPEPPASANPAIAYVGGHYDNVLMVMDADGANATEIYGSAATLSNPSWSPDGLHIAFSRGYELCRIDVTVIDGVPVGQNLVVLLNGAAMAYGPQWSPLGNEILYYTGADVPNELQVIPATGGTPQTLYVSSAPMGVSEPTWSPDASKIAFVESGNPGAFIRELDRSTGTVVTRLSLPPTYVRSLDWGRTDGVLAYTAITYPRGRQVGDIYTLDALTGQTTWRASGFDPSWSPDDGRLVFEGKRGLVSLELATGSTSNLTRGGRWADWLR